MSYECDERASPVAEGELVEETNCFYCSNRVFSAPREKLLIPKGKCVRFVCELCLNKDTQNDRRVNVYVDVRQDERASKANFVLSSKDFRRKIVGINYRL